MSDEGEIFPFDNIFSDFIERTVKPVVRNVAQQIVETMFPLCQHGDCNERSIPSPCERCGRFVCIQHGFVNISLRTICVECVAEVSGAPQMNVDTWPWSELGLEPGASVEDIRRALRHIAKTCHPDKVTDPSKKIEAKVRWVRVSKAYQEALKRAGKQR